MVNDFTCDCNGTGYVGETCHIDIDECQNDDPCIHGQCINNPGNYTCLCSPTYCGTNCQRKDPCQMVSLYLSHLNFFFFRKSYYL